VPEHRKLNRVDLGTADKLAAVVLGVQQESARLQRPPEEVSFILVELGGAFTAAVAVERGQVVDGIGGTAGPIGWQSAGALDGEVAFLAGHISKNALFQGGVSTFVARNPSRLPVATQAYAEGALKAIRQLGHSAPSAQVVLLSGRHSSDPDLVQLLSRGLGDLGTVRRLSGFAREAKQGAQGAAVMADGLAGGRYRGLVQRLGVDQARGTVLDYLLFLSPGDARKRLGLSTDE
jgi:predicted butyrate kinase (DUF1464 family)